jgi:hypothetical protein
VRSTKSRRRGTVSIEYVIVLGTSIVCAGLAAGTAIRTLEYQAAADNTAAAMTADFTQAAAEAVTRADATALNQTGVAVYGTTWTPLTVTAAANGTVDSAATTVGPNVASPLFAGPPALVFP